MLRESATRLRVQSCEADKITMKERKERGRYRKKNLEELKAKEKQEVRGLCGCYISPFHCSQVVGAAAACKNNRHKSKKRCIIYINYILIQIN